MPKERFFRLREEKKREIIEAAEEEFSNYSFENASVSRVVKTSGISQGSFYTYFDGKEDLRQYLISQKYFELEQKFLRTLDQCNGDICDTALYAVTKIMKLDWETKEFRFIKNTILDIGWAGRMQGLDGISRFSLADEFHRFSILCYERTDLRKLRVMDEMGFEALLEILLMIVAKAAVRYATGNTETTKILMIAERQIQLLRE